MRSTTGRPLQETAQAIEGQFDRAQPDPFASAQDARPPNLDPVSGRYADPDRPTEVDAIGAVVQFDQHRQGMSGAGLLARGVGDRLGGFLVEFQWDRDAEQVIQMACDGAVAEDLLGARQVGDAGGDLASGEGFDDCQRRVPRSVRADRVTPSSVWSSSAKMKLPRRLRTSSVTGASLRRTSSMSLPRTVSLVSSCG